MPWHIIVKLKEAEVAPKLPSVFAAKFECFGVEEASDDTVKEQHWHFWTACDWDEAKVRREIDKVRTAKNKGVSIRAWDEDLSYFCKGSCMIIAPSDMDEEYIKGDPGYPSIYCDTLNLAPKHVRELNHEYWLRRRGRAVLDPDFKPPKLLDELVDSVRGKDVTEDEVIRLFITLIESRGGYKCASNRSVGQAYIRTALMFTANAEHYKNKLFSYYKQGLYL